MLNSLGSIANLTKFQGVSAPVIPMTQITPINANFNLTGGGGNGSTRVGTYTMSGNSNTNLNGTYTVTNSSNLGFGYDESLAFQTSSSNGTAYNQGWISYSTSRTTTMNITGYGTVSVDWIQIQVPVAFKLLQYTYCNQTSNGAYNAGRCFKTFWLLASNDNSTWTVVDYQNLASQPTAVTIGLVNYQKLTYNVTTSTAYKYWRLACSQSFTDYLQCDRFELQGTFT